MPDPLFLQPYPSCLPQGLIYSLKATYDQSSFDVSTLHPLTRKSLTRGVHRYWDRVGLYWYNKIVFVEPSGI
jgi:hypothetical protein